MSQKRAYKQYSKEFKAEAVAQGESICMLKYCSALPRMFNILGQLFVALGFDDSMR